MSRANHATQFANSKPAVVSVPRNGSKEQNYRGSKVSEGISAEHPAYSLSLERRNSFSSSNSTFYLS